MLNILYQEGQYVNAGDVLFTIEPDTYEAALKAAKGLKQVQ